MFDLLYFILSNVGKLFSYNRIAKIRGVATDTVKEYLRYAEESYLISSIMKYDASVKKQLINPKKLYGLDTGMINSISFKFSENKGRLLENLVYVNLLRRNRRIYYSKGMGECDFLIKPGLKITAAIQVTLSLKEESVRKREIKGLLEAMKKHDLKEGIILTELENEIIKINGKKIVVQPVYRWLLK